MPLPPHRQEITDEKAALIRRMLAAGHTPKTIHTTTGITYDNDFRSQCLRTGWRSPWKAYELAEFTKAIRLGYTVVELLPLARVDRETFEWRIREQSPTGSPHPDRLKGAAPSAVSQDHPPPGGP